MKLCKLTLAMVIALAMLSCASAHKYHMFEGPPRLEMEVPAMVRTGQRFIMKARLLGESGQLPFDQYVTCIVKANDTVLGTSTYILKNRNISGTIILSVDFFNIYKGRGGMIDTPTDYVDPIPQPLPIEGVDEYDMDLQVRIKMEIWLTEANTDNEMVMVKRILTQTDTTKLSCEEQRCQQRYY